MMFMLLGGLAGSSVTAASAHAESSASAGQSDVLEESLVVPGVQWLDQGAQSVAAEAADRDSPEAVSARAASLTAFEDLDTAQAVKLAGDAFPATMDQPAGGPPELPTGQSISNFVSPDAAQVNLGDGQHGVIESTVPMAIGSSGGWSPIDLALSDSNDAFVAANPLVAVRVPKRVSGGVEIPDSGLSLTPVDTSDSPLDGATGVLDGSAVLYANTQPDTDTVVKPTTFGFDTVTILRSAQSPQQLAYKVGMPPGASLTQEQGSGAVDVVKEGATIATIPPPQAQDGAGTTVPLEMSVSGDILVVKVEHLSNSYLYPIAVDPEFNTTTENLTPGNWHFTPSEAEHHFTYSAGSEGLSMDHKGSFPATNWASVAMQTNGNSHIYEVQVTDILWTDFASSTYEYKPSTYPYLDAYLEIRKESYESHQVTLSGTPYLKAATICAAEGCASSGGLENNAVNFEVTTVESSAALEASGHPEAIPYGGALQSVTTYISQPKETHSTVHYKTSATELEYTAGQKTFNIFNGTHWVGPRSGGAFEFESNDNGLGVSATAVEAWNGSKWETQRSKNYLTQEGGCIGVHCSAAQHEIITYTMINGAMPNGEGKVRVSAHDPMAATSSIEHGEGEATLKVDAENPHGLTLSGLAGTSEKYELGEVEAHVTAEATDGEGSVPSSGIKSLTLAVDGKELVKAAGSCSVGPCSASAEWAINGSELGVGTHTLTVQAVDNANNFATKDFTLSVYHASPVALGPGSVNPESGDFALESADVAISGGSGSLAVTRHYDSLNPKEGEEGALGPQWTLSLGSLASLEVLPDGSVMVVGPAGLTHFSVKAGGGFEAPVGDSSLQLKAEENGEHKVIAYYLEEPASGTSTKFTLPSGANSWMPTLTKGPVATNTVTDEYTTAEPEPGKKIVEPTLEVAPHPQATCEVKKLEKGCRALEFVYATTTTATGENASEWKDYKGRLKEVSFIAYNPASKAMVTTAVARYEYDKQGRLRAEWNPSISPALKTTYGYDAESHVTALTPPGQESWIFTHGTTAGDSRAGRLLKAVQAPTSSGLWAGSLPSNTAAPKITGTPLVGTPLSVSTGTWSNSPVAYAFEWTDCNAAGGECVPIAGATNASYTPVLSDVGHRLVAKVSGLNGGGAVAAASAASGSVNIATEYALPSGSAPSGVAAGPDGKVWFTAKGTNKIGKSTTSGAITEYALPAGSSPYAITAGPDGKMWFTDNGTNKVGKITTAGVVTEYALPASSAPYGIAAGADGNLWVAEWGPDKIAKLTPSGAITHYALPPGSAPVTIIAGPDGNLWFVNDGTHKIGKITTSGALTEYTLPAGPYLVGISAGPDGNVWFTVAGGTTGSKVGKITPSGAISEYPLPVGYPSAIVTGPDGNLWVTTEGAQLAKVALSGASTLYTLPGAGAFSIATGPDGNLWLGVPSTNKLGKVPFNTSQGESHPQPGWTVDYGVPVSGAGAPYEMGLNKTTGKPEPEKWGQADDPAYATAVFAPDTPQDWPATGYKGATVYYLDSQARAVNTAAPTGGISTEEYNAENAVVRSLSADNRAAALKEANSAEVSKLLDTQSAYNSEGQLLETRGPQHIVKLAVGKEKAGEEVQARNHVKYHYDEGAPSGETYSLVTKTEDGAETANKEEFDKRTSVTSYSGQENLGWKLRQPTSTVTDPAGLNLIHKTTYDANTGNVVETRNPGGNSETVYPPAFSAAVGSEGAGNGQFNRPAGVATDASGNTWVIDKNNGRVEKLSPTGTFLAAYGSKGTGNGQFMNPWGIAINQSNGNVYVADTDNNRIEVLSPSGAFVASYGTAGASALKEPIGVTLDSSGDIWTTDWAHNRIEEFSATGEFMKEVGTYGTGSGQLSGPTGIVISEGSVYTVDSGNSRIEQFSLSGEYVGQFGSKGSGAVQFKEAVGIAANPSTGNLYVADTYNYRVQEFSPAGRFLTEWRTWGPKHEISYPTGLVVNSTGKLYITDQFANQLSSWTPPEAGAARLTYASQFGASGSGSGQFSTPIASSIDGQGYIWVTDYGNNRVEKFSSKGSFIAAYGTEGSGNLQFHGPGGIDVNQSTGNVYISDAGNHRVEELSSSGTFVRAFGFSGAGELSSPGGLKIDSAGNVWVPDMSANKIVEFSSTGTFIATYGKEGTGEVQFKRPVAIAFSGTSLWVTDSGNHRAQRLSSTGTYLGQYGGEGEGSGELYSPEGIAADSAGNLYVVDDGASHVQEFSSTGVYRATFATKGSGEGQLKAPIGDSIDAAGNMYVVDSENNRVEKWTAVNQAAHATQNVYYTAGTEASVAACRSHPEWANLLCQTRPTAQPGTSGLPELPTKTTVYNIWNQPEVITEAFGSVTRTRTTTFDSAGRPLTTEIMSANNVPLPKVTDTYNTTNGTLEKQSTTFAGTTKTITSTYTTWGQLASYTDADSNTAKYIYDEDGRVTKLNDGSAEGAGEQSYTYDKVTGLFTRLIDSGAGTFTAAYDVQGKMTSESYPNGMSAYYTYNSASSATVLEYKKLTHCTENCTWLSDSIVPSIHGETMKQTSNLSEEPNYSYDAAGRLTQVQETPVGEGCTTRIYSYEEDGNRTGLTTRKPGPEGKCAPEGGSLEPHTYDPADRFTDAGVTYEAFGNITTLPAADAGGTEGSEITSGYYVDGQLFNQLQNGETSEYKLDPEERTRETVTSGKTAATSIMHYDESGSTNAWTGESAGKWTRNISGINGALAAVQSNATTVVLQLHDLQGNIVASVGNSELETKLTSKYNSTEFGVPQPGTSPPKYAWQGASGVTSEQSSGLIAKDGVTYVPQIGQPLQAPSNLTPGVPDNFATPYVSTIAPWVAAFAASTAANATAKREQEIREREAAERPPGVVPVPECNIETEGCAADPEHGMNLYHCTVSSHWIDKALIEGVVNCAKQTQLIVMQIEIWRVQDGKYVRVFLGKEHFYAKRHVEWDVEPPDHCIPQKWYRGWVYGSVWLYGQFVWSGSGVNPRNSQCYLSGPGLFEDPVGGEPGGSEAD